MATRKQTQNDSIIEAEQENSNSQDKSNNYYERMLLDKQSKGYQILREYVYYFGYNFKELCHLVDAQERHVISKNELRSIFNMNKNDFYLTAEHIEEILTDLQTTFDGNDHLIPYIESYQIMRQYPPKTKYAIPLLYGTKKKNPEDHQYDLWEKEVERTRRNFWDRKEPGQAWDLNYGDLGRLEIAIMQSQRDENGNIIQEQEEKEEEVKVKGKFKQMTENEQYEKSIKNLYQMNNETILKNFDVKIAQQIAKSVKPSNVVNLTDEQLEKVFKSNLGSDFRRPGKVERIKHYFEDDFIKLFNDNFNKEIKLSEEEIQLLHYRIWEDNNFGHFTYESFAKWVNKNRSQKIRELRTIGLSEQDQRRILNKQETSSPKLFKELVKYAYSFGLNFLSMSLKPITERDNYVLLNNIPLYFKSLNITFSPQDINDLKFYLANHGCIHLQDTSSQGFLNTSLLLDSRKLIDLITREAQKIAMHTIDFKAVGNKSKEQARRSVQSKIIQGVIDKLNIKLKVYSDDNDLIEEIKLRKVVADYFSEIDQSDLDLIFSKLQNVTQPSKYVSQRKIYLPEFVEFLLGGPLFDDNLFQKINEYEKYQKIRDLGISQESKVHSVQFDTKELDQMKQQQSKLQGKDLVLDLDYLQDGKQNTQETERSVLPGQFSFRNAPNIPSTTSQAANAIKIEEQQDVPKKFTVITKQSIQQQILQEKKDAKKVKTVSTNTKGNNAVDQIYSQEHKENTTSNILQMAEQDSSWTPDYRKIALDELIQKEKPKPGIDYIKGGFIYEEDSDSAFSAKPLDDRQVIYKLFESLKRKLLTGSKASLSDFDSVDYVLIQFRNKLQQMDTNHKGVITLQQFYSFIKLNFMEFTPQECYQLNSIAESYSATNQYVNEAERPISYTFFCMNLHKYICTNLLFGQTPSELKW